MTLHALPFVSLDAATVAGTGASRDLEGVGSIFGVLVFATGSPSTVTVQLEGSHDDVNWFAVGSPTITTAPSYTNFTDLAFRYVRANLVTLSGGSAPTVTVSIATVA